MQPLSCCLNLLIVLILTLSDWQVEAASRNRLLDDAASWLRTHSRKGPPGMDELAELKGANPEAYAIVQALLTKKAMGLIKPNEHHSIPVAPPPDITPDTAPNVTQFLNGLRPPTEAVGRTSAAVLEGPPGLVFDNSGPPPAELPELWKVKPEVAVLPPPPPLSDPPPPPLPELNFTMPHPYTGASASEETLPESLDVSKPIAYESSVVVSKPIGLSATSATMTRSSASGGHDWLNWKPDQMIVENERMVQNVLGAVAQLTGGRTPRAPKSSSTSIDAGEEEHRVSSPAAPEETQQVHKSESSKGSLDPAPPMQNDGANVLQAMSSLPLADAPKIAAPPPKTSAPAQAVVPPSPADMPQKDPEVDVSLDTPSSVNWRNPFTFTANANSQAKPPPQENQFLKGIDLGVPTVTLPPRKSADEDNPYLQGLNLAGTPQPPIKADLKPAALSAMHKSQLLTSHKLLSSFDWGDGRHHTNAKQERQSSASKKDEPTLKGWLASGKKQSGPTLAKSLDTARKALASSDDDLNNPYLQVFGLKSDHDDQKQLDEYVSNSPNLRGTPQPGKPDPRYPLASFKWDDDDSKSSSHNQPAHRLSMASSVVHENANIKKDTSKNSLQGWLKVASSPKVPDARAQKLHESIEQTVADDNNPYLKGLNLDGTAASQSGQGHGNVYLNNLN